MNFKNKKGMLQLWVIIILIYLSIGIIFGGLALNHSVSFLKSDQLYPIKGGGFEIRPFQTFFINMLIYPANIVTGNLCPYYDVTGDNYKKNCFK